MPQLHCTVAHTQLCGDLREGQAVVVAQDDDVRQLPGQILQRRRQSVQQLGLNDAVLRQRAVRQILRQLLCRAVFRVMT